MFVSCCCYCVLFLTCCLHKPKQLLPKVIYSSCCLQCCYFVSLSYCFYLNKSILKFYFLKFIYKIIMICFKFFYIFCCFFLKKIYKLLPCFKVIIHFFIWQFFFWLFNTIFVVFNDLLKNCLYIFFFRSKKV